MKSLELYNKLEQDFITEEMSDDWFEYMENIKSFICNNFKKRSMGLVCDFATEINKVYTAVFPSNKVMEKILYDQAENALLFVHHPSIWDIRKAPDVFHNMDVKLLEKFKERNIAIYNLHVPLDNYGEYSTSVSLAKALNVKIETAFALYFGALCGVFGYTKAKDLTQLRMIFENAVKHEVKLYKYGQEEITGKVAIVAGGGLVETIEDVIANKAQVLVTGITTISDHTKEAHELAKKHGINILGGTHYSTEKFACISMVDYFRKLGLEAEFIEDEPVLEDM